MSLTYRTFKHLSKRKFWIITLGFFYKWNIHLLPFMIMLNHNLIITDNIDFGFSSIGSVPQIYANKSAIWCFYWLVSSPLFTNNSSIYSMAQISFQLPYCQRRSSCNSNCPCFFMIPSYSLS